MRSKPTWHAEAMSMFESGCKVTEIAEQLGYSVSAVWRVVHPERAEEMRRRSESRPERKAAKRDWQRQNARPPMIAVDEDPGIPGMLPIRSRVGDTLSIIDFARVDIADWDRLRKYRWSRVGNGGYVATQVATDGPKKRARIYLHHMVQPIDRAAGLECDHINRDPMDNRRVNLRLVTRKQNNNNRGGMFAKDAA